MLFKAGGQIGGEPGVVDGVRAKQGEHASAFGDAADFVHLHPVAELVQDRPVPGLDDATAQCAFWVLRWPCGQNGPVYMLQGHIM